MMAAAEARYLVFGNFNLGWFLFHTEPIHMRIDTPIVTTPRKDRENSIGSQEARGSGCVLLIVPKIVPISDEHQ